MRKIIRKIIIILLLLVAVFYNKVGNMSLNGQVFVRHYPIENCSDNMYFKKNTVIITYGDCREYKGGYEVTRNYRYKNGVLVIDGLEVLSTSIGYGESDKIIIKRDNEIGYIEFHRIN